LTHSHTHTAEDTEHLQQTLRHVPHTHQLQLHCWYSGQILENTEHALDTSLEPGSHLLLSPKLLTPLKPVRAAWSTAEGTAGVWPFFFFTPGALLRKGQKGTKPIKR